MAKKILLVEPNFPFPNKSKNQANSVHKNFVPLGLLKLGTFHKNEGSKVRLVRGNQNIRFEPDEILVTSLFTYWSNHVWECIDFYRNKYPKARIKLGGIYATLHKDKGKFKEQKEKYKIETFSGVIPEAEKFTPDYSLIPAIDYHATHMMRGCIRRCAFCGTWKIEPKLTHKSKEDITKELKEVGKNKVIFYDNNLLANPHIIDILTFFQDLRINKKPVTFESQSGFDGRLLEKNPKLAKLLKKARFQNVRIAWDNELGDKDSIKKQIKSLTKAGYLAKDISVFMIYNFSIPYEDMLKKVDVCYKWGVQITDCRNRPLDLDYDNYNPHMRGGQPEGSFYIHKKGGWTDEKIRGFRKRVRIHNIEIRYAKDKGLRYDHKMEKWSAIHNLYKFFKLGRPPQMTLIESNSNIKKRIELLRKLQTYHKKFSIKPPDLSQCSMQKLDRFLKHLFKQEKINADYEETKLRNILTNLEINKASLRY